MRGQTQTRVLRGKMKDNTPKYFDTHCHLGGTELKEQALLLSERALQNNVCGLALISADVGNLKDVPRVAELLREKLPELKVAYSAGLHPHEAQHASSDFLKELRAEMQRASAIGETGLDYYYEHSNREEQKRVFQWHIDQAVDLKKPLVIHCRNAAEDMLTFLSQDSLKKHPKPGIFHCFTEDQSTADKAVNLGFYISISGIITFKNADALRSIVKKLPLDRILIETDAPWLAPVPFRGKTNEPSFVKHVFECICTLRDEPVDVIQEQLWKNSCEVFGVEA